MVWSDHSPSLPSIYSCKLNKKGCSWFWCLGAFCLPRRRLGMHSSTSSRRGLYETELRTSKFHELRLRALSLQTLFTFPQPTSVTLWRLPNTREKIQTWFAGGYLWYGWSQPERECWHRSIIELLHSWINQATKVLPNITGQSQVTRAGTAMLTFWML